MHDRGHVGLRAPPAGDHRPRDRRPADDRRARQLDHVQRRDLQLHRAARRARARATFRTTSDTEVVLRAYRPLGRDVRSTGCAACSRSRSGTRPSRRLFCARDRFGIKPLYYTVVDGTFYLRVRGRRRCCRSCRTIETDLDGLKRLPRVPVLPRRQDAVQGRPRAAARPLAHASQNGSVRVAALLGGLLRARLRPHRALLRRAARASSSTTRSTLHLRADVPVGAYLSGGLDSSIVASLAATRRRHELHRRSPASSPAARLRREPLRARASPSERGFELHEVEIGAAGLRRHDPRASSTTSTIPVAGPGSFPQYMVSRARARAHARSCSAARAATRSSAATRAT